LKRRLREAVRLNLRQLGPEWAVVLNPRRSALNVPFDALEREVIRVFSKCAAS
jgi:ribonuclease P protein component